MDNLGITEADLERRIEYLNVLTRNPVKSYTFYAVSGTRTASENKRPAQNAGNYHFGNSGKLYSLEQFSVDGWGVDVIISRRPITELYYAINMFIKGIHAAHKSALKE